MDTSTLTRLILSDWEIKKNFGGVFPSDRLPANRRNYRSFVVNTDPANMKGSHWQAIYFDQTDCANFFCSYGSVPEGSILNFMRNNSRTLKYNPRTYQHVMTSSCGLFCLYFLYHVNRNLRISQLTDDTCQNERVVQNFAQARFRLTPLDAGKLNQVCVARSRGNGEIRLLRF